MFQNSFQQFFYRSMRFFTHPAMILIQLALIPLIYTTSPLLGFLLTAIFVTAVFSRLAIYFENRFDKKEAAAENESTSGAGTTRTRVRQAGDHDKISDREQMMRINSIIREMEINFD